jgi:hypothetical protein
MCLADSTGATLTLTHVCLNKYDTYSSRIRLTPQSIQPFLMQGSTYHCHVRPTRNEIQSGGGADAAGPAGDQTHFSVQIHFLSFDRPISGNAGGQRSFRQQYGIPGVYDISVPGENKQPEIRIRTARHCG